MEKINKMFFAVFFLLLSMPAFSQYFYDASGTIQGRKDGNYFYDGSGNILGRKDGNYIYDGSGNIMGRLDGDYIYDSSGSIKGRTDKIEKEDAVLFYFFCFQKK